MLDEDEEGVLHLPRREPEAADDLLQRQRAVAQEAAAHLGYEGAEVIGDDADGEEDAVLRHHGREPRGGEGIAGVLGARCGGRWWSRRA